jgi:hypothetical protein
MDDATPTPGSKPPPTRQRLLWFAGIYLASLAGFVTFVYAFRAIIPG